MIQEEGFPETGTVDATNIVLSCAGSVSLQFRKNDSE